jgi:hypothetical protein
MILVNKPDKVPRSLRAGVAETASNCEAYDANPKGYREGREKFEFKSAIYGALEVKVTLKEAQHSKCCFCESRFEANYAGDVEHYRPKGAVGSGKSRILPGYYWLAYSWENLYYACADCNQYRKRAAFPLAHEAKRVRDHHGVLMEEDPLILDPGGPRNPRDHIRFNRDVPMWTTPAGRTTIDRIKLDRDELNRKRRKHFRLLEALLEIIRLAQDDPRPDRVRAVREARASLRDLMKPEEEFSAASQDFLEQYRAIWDVDQD